MLRKEMRAEFAEQLADLTPDLADLMPPPLSRAHPDADSP
jgi:hypothetical protein